MPKDLRRLGLNVLHFGLGKRGHLDPLRITPFRGQANIALSIGILVMRGTELG
jgi:hypothetical protein